MASSIEVNPNTVNRSFAYLQELGIIENKRGIDYFVTTNAVEKIINIKRKEFIELEIPHIAKMVRTLNLSRVLKIFFNGHMELARKFPKNQDDVFRKAEGLFHCASPVYL